MKVEKIKAVYPKNNRKTMIKEMARDFLFSNRRTINVPTPAKI